MSSCPSHKQNPSLLCSQVWRVRHGSLLCRIYLESTWQLPVHGASTGGLAKCIVSARNVTSVSKPSKEQ